MSNIVKREGHLPFVTIPNEIAQDNNLTIEALGLLVNLLSRPPDWTVQISELQNRRKLGRDKARRILDELAEAGYVTKPKKYRDDKGRWQYTPYIVRPFTEKPSTDKPSTENQSSLKRKKEKKKENTTEPAKAAPVAAANNPKPRTRKRDLLWEKVLYFFSDGVIVYQDYKDEGKAVPAGSAKQATVITKELRGYFPHATPEEYTEFHTWVGTQSFTFPKGAASVASNFSAWKKLKEAPPSKLYMD